MTLTLLLMLCQELYYTGDDDEDAQVLDMVQQLLHVVKFVSSLTHLLVYHTYISTLINHTYINTVGAN